MTGPGLARALGFGALTGVTINGIVGAGILGLPAKTYALLGNWSLPAWALCAALLALVGVCFAQLSAERAESGGPYVYVREAFGGFAGFLAGWVAFLSRLFSFGMIANLFATYAAGFWPALGDGLGRIGLISFLALALVLPLARGIALSGTLATVFTVAKLSILALFVLLAAPHWGALATGWAAPPAPGAWQAAMTAMVSALAGFEIASLLGGEIASPERIARPSMAASLAVVALFYMAIQAGAIVLVPQLAEASRPVAEGAALAGGRLAGGIVSVGALIAMGGTLFALLMAMPRLLLAMAEAGQMPSMLARIDPVRRVPVPALLLSALGGWAVAVTGSFLAAAIATAVTRLLVYAATCAAFLALRQRGAASRAIAALAIVGTSALVFGAGAAELRMVAITIAAGLPFALLPRLARRRGIA